MKVNNRQRSMEANVEARIKNAEVVASLFIRSITNAVPLPRYTFVIRA